MGQQSLPRDDGWCGDAQPVPGTGAGPVGGGDGGRDVVPEDDYEGVPVRIVSPGADEPVAM
jgi:hypothetical protein